MWLKSPNINVTINIRGDIENSEIVGVKIEGSNKSSQSLNGNLFQYFFVNYLGLPSLAEIQSRLSVSKAIRQGDYFEGYSVHHLWDQLTYHMHVTPNPISYDRLASEGTVVRLHNVQLTAFLNRRPGYNYTNPEIPDPEDFLVAPEDFLVAPEDFLTSWVGGEDMVIERYGLGDIRFGSIDDKYLLNMVSNGRGQWGRYDLNLEYLEKFKDIAEDIFEEIKVGWKSHKFVTGDTAFGFPVIVTDSVYKTLESLLDDYGALYVEEITGILQSVPHHLPLTWPPGVPKIVLYIGARSSIKGIQKPSPMVASAWSLVTNSQGDRYQYAYWPFFVGVKNYQKTIKNATNFIKSVMAESALEPIFEFDCKYNWFSDQTPFTPDNIIDLYKSIRINDKMKESRQTPHTREY